MPQRAHYRRDARTLRAGFTLIELMVVMVIIGVVVAGTLLSLGSVGRDSELEKERDRLYALIDYVRERAALQTVEYGLRCEQGGFRFVMYDSRQASWIEDPLDESLRARTLPAGLDLSLKIEDRQIVLPKHTQASGSAAKGSAAKGGRPLDLTPQIMLFSSGDLTSFKLTLARAAAGRSALLSSTPTMKVEKGDIVEKPT